MMKDSSLAEQSISRVSWAGIILKNVESLERYFIIWSYSGQAWNQSLEIKLPKFEIFYQRIDSNDLLEANEDAAVA